MTKVFSKVWLAKKKKQKLVTIPRDCGIETGDYVSIEKLSEA